MRRGEEAPVAKIILGKQKTYAVLNSIGALLLDEP